MASMARRTIESAPTGETFVFDDAWSEPDGRVRRLEYVLQPKASAPSHFHPRAAQSFEVLSGTLHIKVNGRVRVLKAGDRAVTGLGEAHSQWNEGPEPVRAIEGYNPPIAMEPFFTILPHAIGSRNPLKIAVFFSDFRSVSGPGTISMWIMTTLLAPIGRLCGFKDWYRDLVQ
jgi:mannose-6-phosphate isomerase-like protein (cupin superfamily)